MRSTTGPGADPRIRRQLTSTRRIAAASARPGTWLLARNQPILQREIVHALKVSRATVSDLIEVLRVDGHVTTAQGAEDKRQVLVALTRQGKR